MPEGGDTSQVIVVPATGDAGAYRVDDLKKGTYALEETIVPNGYEQPFKATFSLTNADNGATVNVRDDAAQAVAVTKTAGTWDASGVTNARTLGSLALTKVGEQNEPLAGVLFLLERSEAGAWSTVGTYATGVDGTLVVSDLAWGCVPHLRDEGGAGLRAGRQRGADRVRGGAEQRHRREADLGSRNHCERADEHCHREGGRCRNAAAPRRRAPQAEGRLR